MHLVVGALALITPQYTYALLYPAPSKMSCHIQHTVLMVMKTWPVVDSSVLHRYKIYSTYVTGFARRGLIRAPLQNTDFTTILLIHHQTIHVCMFCSQQFTSLLFLRLLSEPCQSSMNSRFVLSRLCWLFN